ncbi:MAG: heme exporter protein CcmB [Wenzhouxiangellaceae bacterium]
MLSGFWALLRRDLMLAIRRRQEVLWPLWFALLVVTLFPFGITPEPQLIARIAPGIIWIATLLAGLLTLDPLFRTDAEDGTLEQWLLSPTPLPVLALARIVAHWLISGLPLLVIAPVLGVMMNMPPAVLWVLIKSLLLGGPLASALGATGAALALGAGRSGFLVSMLVLPWYIPLLIFATGAISSAAQGLPSDSHLIMLAALLVLTLTLSPFAVAAGLRINLSH